MSAVASEIGTFETCRRTPSNVRYQGQPGRHLLAMSSSQFDPHVWSGRALQEVRRSGGKRSCINVSGL
jgi:hypothetical protein